MRQREDSIYNSERECQGVLYRYKNEKGRMRPMRKKCYKER